MESTRPRYFQYLNKKSPFFGKVTELLRIENVMDTDAETEVETYVFKDGSKIAAYKVGPLNHMEAYGAFNMVEVSSPENKWLFNVSEMTEKSLLAPTGENGEMAQVVNPYMNVQGFGNIKVTVISKPRYVNPSSIAKQTSTDKPTDRNTDLVKIDNSNDSLVETKVIQTFETINTSNVQNREIDIVTESLVNSDYATKDNDTITIDLDKIENDSNNGGINIIIDGTTWELDINELKERILNPVQEPHIMVNLEDKQRELIENMINVSKKEDCDIDMLVTLSIPPVSLYNLIREVYPSGMANGYVNIIADKIKSTDLKYAVADGLLSYYQGDLVVDDTEDNVDCEEVVTELTNENISDVSIDTSIFDNKLTN